jgi:uncharacterized membrane protein
MLAVQVIFGVILVGAGTALLLIGWRGVRGRLRPNRYAGVRTEATLRSEAAFEIGNRAAGPALIAAGAVGLLCGASLPLLPALSSVVLVTVIGVIGGFALMTIGGLVGNRAAQAVPQPSTAGCAGCTGAGCGAVRCG